MPEEKSSDRDSDVNVAAKGSPSKARQSAGGPGDHPKELHSPLFPLLWLLFPFLAMLTYGLLTRH
jgi:hypothetical protein